MLKINFKPSFPHSQRDKFIHVFRDLGFSYEQIIQNEEYSLLRFFGKIPAAEKNNTNVDVMFCDDVNINDFKSLSVGNVEIYVLFERS